MSSHRKTRKRLSLITAAATAATAALAAVFALAMAGGTHGGSPGAAQRLAANRVPWRPAHRHPHRHRHFHPASPSPSPSLSPSSSPSPSPSPSVIVSASPSPSPSTAASTSPPVSTTGFPGASDTGVPAGTALSTVGPGGLTSGTGWVYDPRGWVEVTGSNVTLQDLYIPFSVDITSASNVTLKDDRIYGAGAAQWGVSMRHDQNVTIEDDSIYGPADCADQMWEGIGDVYQDSTGIKIEADNIWSTGGAIGITNGVIQGNYLHGLTNCGAEHNDVIGTDSGSTSLIIEGNTILNPLDQTCAVCLFSDFGQVQNVTIEHNLIGGGDYALYGGLSGEQAASTTPGVTITGNEFSTAYYPDGGTFGPDAHVWSGDVWSGNTWADGPDAGQTVSR